MKLFMLYPFRGEGFLNETSIGVNLKLEKYRVKYVNNDELRIVNDSINND